MKKKNQSKPLFNQFEHQPSIHFFYDHVWHLWFICKRVAVQARFVLESICLSQKYM